MFFISFFKFLFSVKDAENVRPAAEEPLEKPPPHGKIILPQKNKALETESLKKDQDHER